MDSKSAKLREIQNRIEQNICELEKNILFKNQRKTLNEDVKDGSLRTDNVTETVAHKRLTNNSVTENASNIKCENLIGFMKDELNEFTPVSKKTDDLPKETEHILPKTNIKCDLKAISGTHNECANKLSNSFQIKQIDDEGFLKTKASDKSVLTKSVPENVAKPQMIILKISHTDKIADIDALLRHRIGKGFRYQIHNIESRPNCTEVLIEFPSKTSTRNAEYLLQVSNGKEGVTFLFCPFIEKKSSKPGNTEKTEKENSSLKDIKLKSEQNFYLKNVNSEKEKLENNKLLLLPTKEVPIQVQTGNIPYKKKDNGKFIQTEDVTSNRSDAKVKQTNLDDRTEQVRANNEIRQTTFIGNQSEISKPLKDEPSEINIKDEISNKRNTTFGTDTSLRSQVSCESIKRNYDENQQNTLKVDKSGKQIMKEDQNIKTTRKDCNTAAMITTLKTNAPKPQKIVLQISDCADINSFETFLKQRLGKNIKFRIQVVKRKDEYAYILVEFASKTGSRKAIDILHQSNDGEKQKVLWQVYTEKKSTTAIVDSKHKVESSKHTDTKKEDTSKKIQKTAQFTENHYESDASKVTEIGTKNEVRQKLNADGNKKSDIKCKNEKESNDKDSKRDLDASSKCKENGDKKESLTLKNDFETENEDMDKPFQMKPHKNEPPSKCQAQILEIEITNLDRKESNYKSYLLQRLKTCIQFEIKDVDTVENVVFLSVEFPSTNLAKQAKQSLHKSNTISKTTIRCTFSKDRKSEIKKKRLSKLVVSVADKTEELLFDHNGELNEILVQISKLEEGGKKRKLYALDDYERKKKEKVALLSKRMEMENHKIEFKSFLSSLYNNLATLRDSEYNERDLTQLETAFKIECARFSSKLPIYARRTDIVKLVDNHQSSIILGETGSGKSTQVIQYLFQTGRFAEGTIVCTQPRKVAAISLATRVAQELVSKVGHVVGYQVGLQTKKSKETKLLYVTDHVLLNECLKDPLLSAYSCIVIDEAHERSIFTDLLLGMIKKCLVSRPELRVIITSATIDPDIFVNFFGGRCPVLSVSGRAFPVDISWSEEDYCDDKYEQKTLEKAIEVHKTENQGDILVFLTSPLEVDRCCRRFEDKFYNRNNFICLPLHGKLQANEQQKVFIPPPKGKRKIVFATNSAETSITIPGIKYVIDSGRIKEMQFDSKKNISSLVVTLVTKSSANQRSGRAGRTAPGKCFRLYSKEEYGEMKACSSPEILRVNLGQALLKLIELGVDPISFDFVESPPRDQLTLAMDTLESIGAVCDGVITELGKWIAKLPFQPIYGVLVHDALEHKVGIEALVLTACCGSGGSLFVRFGSSEEKLNADKMKIRFAHQGGDLMTMLNAYREWHQQPEKSKGKWCKENYVNGKTIRIVRDTVTEVLDILRKELKIRLEFKFNSPESVDVVLQKMLFKTFKHNICHFLGHEKAGYHVIHKVHNVCLFPSSALPSLGLQPEWIVIEQILQINRDYGVNATPIPVEWIDDGIKEGWLKEFGMERAEKQKVKQILLYGVGDQSFRDFVGPRYVRLKELENSFQNTFSGSIVIVDTDNKANEISVFGTVAALPKVKPLLDSILVPIQTKYKGEKSEQYLSSSKHGTRAVMSAGCNVADVLMPDEYKSVMVISDQFTTSQLTEVDVRQEFEKYGKVGLVEQFHYTKNKRNWGKVTFETSQEAEYAVEESREEEIVAKPTGNARLQNEHRFKAKLEWCRRSSKCCGFVEFSDRRYVDNILQNRRIIPIGGTEVRLARAKNNYNQIFVSNLNAFVNEEVLKNSFLDRFHLDDDHIVRASVVRHKVNTSRQDLETIQRRLQAHLKVYVKDGRYTVNLRPPKPQDFTFLAFASFSKIEEGKNACQQLIRNFRPDGKIVTATVTLQASLLVIRPIYEHCSGLILKAINLLNKQDGTEIRHKLYHNGNCAIDINCDHIDTLHRVRRKLDKIIQGRKMTKQEFPNIHELFSRAGKYELRNIAKTTEVFILDDYRILEISIYGDRDKQERAFSVLHDYLRKLSLGTNKTLSLRGPDKPFGIIKQMFIRFGIDLGKLKKDIKGLNSLQIDLRNHTVSINGTPKAVETTVEDVEKIIDDLRASQNCDHVENEERQCAICLMEIEEGEIYRLEACGHPFCKTCIVPQLESAVGNNDFPISCCMANCEELWAWRDLTTVALLSGMSVNNLVNRAVNSFVAKNDKEYKFCISPDCPSIYRVTVKSDVFCCCECEARTCTACHTQYHDGFTCKMVEELKEDPSGMRVWMQKDPKNRKLCPNCDLPIEKAGGCDHMECSKCRRHICWVCLEHFPSSRDCYRHLKDVHGGFGGGYGGYL